MKKLILILFLLPVMCKAQYIGKPKKEIWASILRDSLEYNVYIERINTTDKVLFIQDDMGTSAKLHLYKNICDNVQYQIPLTRLNDTIQNLDRMIVREDTNTFIWKTNYLTYSIKNVNLEYNSKKGYEPTFNFMLELNNRNY